MWLVDPIYLLIGGAVVAGLLAIDITNKRECPVCEDDTVGFFCMGLPGWACHNHTPDGSPISGGFGAFMGATFGASRFYTYCRHCNSYWKMLWKWVTGTLD